MANRNLNAEELTRANELLAEIREQLNEMASGDQLLLFAYRRKIVKELGYDERSKPCARQTQGNQMGFAEWKMRPLPQRNAVEVFRT